METVEVESRAEWRAWLAANHDTASEVWLVYYKKSTGKRSIEYEASVMEALCYGWVDSIIKKLDDARYARKFTPRKESSKWSPSNIRRAETLIREGRMTEHGLKLVEAARQSGAWDNPVQRPELNYEIHPAFAEALRENRQAAETFESLAPTYQKQYLGWIEVAKKPETQERRIREAIELLEAGKKLGLR